MRADSNPVSGPRYRGEVPKNMETPQKQIDVCRLFHASLRRFGLTERHSVIADGASASIA
jgi:hypothetical protein